MGMYSWMKNMKHWAIYQLQLKVINNGEISIAKLMCLLKVTYKKTAMQIIADNNLIRSSCPIIYIE